MSNASSKQPSQRKKQAAKPRDDSAIGTVGPDDYTEQKIAIKQSGEAGVLQPLPRHKVPWSPWVAILFAVVLYFAAQILASLLISIYPRAHGWSNARASDWLTSAVTAQFWFILLAETITVGATWWFIKKRGAKLRVIGWRKPEWFSIVYALAGFFVYFIAYIALFKIVTHLIPSLNVDQKQQLGFNNVTGNLPLLLTFISLVVLPPIAEETVFRGFVFTGLRNKLSPVYAALITSAIFASAHLEFGSGQPLLWVAALDTFTLSLVLCYLRQKTDSLWPGIFLHALKNGLAFVSLYLIHAH